MPEVTMDFVMQHSEVKKLYPLNLSETMELSKFQSLTAEEKLQVRVPVVIDGAKWVASDRPLDSVTEIDEAHIVSSDGALVAKQIRRRKFNIRKPQASADGSGQTLVGVEYIGNLYPPGKIKPLERMKEQMANGSEMLNGNDPLGALESLELDLQAPPTGAAQNMSAFSEEAEKDQAAKRPTGLRQELSEKVEKLNAANAYPLQKFNFEHGMLVAYITATDKKVEAVATAEPRTENGKYVISASAPPAIQEQFAAGDPVPKKYLQREYKLSFRQAKPGKIQGIVAAIPAGGIVELTRFLKEERLEADESKTDLVYQIFGKELYPTIIDFFFGDKIKEDPKTHGGVEAAGIIEQKSTIRYRTKNGQPGKQQFISRLLKNNRGRSVLIDSNYFPLKTYETIPYNKTWTDEEIETLNMSVFSSLVNNTRTNEEGKTKFQQLSAQDAARIKVDAEGNIVSTYFTNDVNNREPIQVTPFWDKKGEPISDIEIPVKEKRMSKEGTPMNPRLKAISTTDEKVLNDPELRKLTSLYSGRFDNVLEAAHGVITVESLRALTKRSTGKTAKPSNTMSNEQLIKLRLGLASNAIDSSDIAFAEADYTDFTQIENQITDLRMAAGVK